MSKTLRSASILFIALFGLWGIASSQTLRVAIFDEPNSLNFMEQAGLPATWTAWNTFDQLVRYDYKTNELVPELALSWEQETETSWLVHLRPGVQFHHGYGEMTAEDVVFAVNYIIDNNQRIKFLYTAAQVRNTEVVDRYTVRYNLNQPFTPFVLTALQGFGGLVLSKAAFEEMGAQAFARRPVGTGPFAVEEWVSGDHIRMVAHEEYWDARYPLVDALEWRFIPDSSVKTNMLAVGEVDFIDSMPYQDIAALEAQPDVTVQTTPGWNWAYISFGDAQTGPFADARVRQAISYAINRQEIVDSVYFGYAIPAEKPLPPGFLYEDPSITKYGPTPDLERARELLAEAGYADGFSSELYVGSQDQLRRAAVIIANQLQEVGIMLQPRFLDAASYSQSRRSTGDFVDLGPITIMSPDPDTAIHWFWRTGQAITRNFSNPAIDAMILDAAEPTDPAVRAQRYSELQQAMLDEAWFLYITHYSLVRAMRANVTGYEVTPQDMDIYFKYVDIAD